MISAWPGRDQSAPSYLPGLVKELAEHAEVEVVVSGSPNGRDPSAELASGVRLRGDAEFDWLKEVRGYDRCLFVLAGSAPYLHALELGFRVPGIALLHDVRLLGLYRQLQRQRYLPQPVWLENKLTELYSGRISPALARRIAYGGEEDSRVTMTAEVQANAERILVHSNYQAELLDFDRPGRPPAIEIVPFGLPVREMRPVSEPGGPPLIVVSGDPTPALGAAVAQLETEHPGIRLARRDELGERELARAGLAVRMDPDPDAGRPSEDVAEFVATGIPVLVSNRGWQAELPEPVVVTVPEEIGVASLAQRISSILADSAERQSIRTAQEAFVAENSMTRVAERYAELLAL